MKKLLIAAIAASALGIAGTAHASCITAGETDVFRAQMSGVSVFARTIAPGAALGSGPAVGATACTDPSAGQASQRTHIVITDTASNETLCDVWADAAHASVGFDPFGFPGFGGGVHMDPATSGCGINLAWDTLSFAASIPSGGDPTHVEGIDVGTDAAGPWVAHKKGAVVTQAAGTDDGVWWAGGSLSGSAALDADGSIARGAGAVVS